MVSITGSTGAGVRVSQAAAPTIKKVALELGGKSAFLIAPGADLDEAVPNAVRGAFVNNGQTCAATTRLIVPNSVIDEVEQRVAAMVNAFVIGNPLDPSVTLGPVASAGQFKTVKDYIDIGMTEGTLIAGGPGAVDGFDRGYFVKPTVFSRLSPKARVVQEEIFGPVLVILGYDTLEEGIAIANDSEFGLAGYVWSPDTARAQAVGRRLRVGMVGINGGMFTGADMPFGGMRHSGVGREWGVEGLEEFLDVQTIAHRTPRG